MKTQAQDIRWIQRLSNYEKALGYLVKAVELSKTRGLSELEKQGLIQNFEIIQELSWKTMKDFLEYQGNQDIKGSRDAIRAAFKISIISNADLWMQMIQTRNQTTHVYDENILEDVTKEIITAYYPLFLSFKEEMLTLKEKELNEKK